MLNIPWNIKEGKSFGKPNICLFTLSLENYNITLPCVALLAPIQSDIVSDLNFLF